MSSFSYRHVSYFPEQFMPNMGILSCHSMLLTDWIADSMWWLDLKCPTLWHWVKFHRASMTLGVVKLEKYLQTLKRVLLRTPAATCCAIMWVEMSWLLIGEDWNAKTQGRQPGSKIETLAWVPGDILSLQSYTFLSTVYPIFFPGQKGP